MPLKHIRQLKLGVAFMCSLTSTPLFAGVRNPHVDSIKNLLGVSIDSQSPTDTVTINRMNKLAADYFQSNPDSAYYYGQKGIQLARKIKYDEGIANGLLQTGHVNYFKGRSEKAQQDFDEAIGIFKRLKNDKGLSMCYVSLGRMYTLLADYKQALVYLNLALQINQRIKDEKALADNYKNIGVVYYSQGELSKALDFYYKGLFIAVKNHYSGLSAELYNDIGLVLQNMEVYPKAIEHYQKALNLFQGTKNYQAIATVNENIGEVLLAQKEYGKAIGYLSSSLKVAKSQGDIDGLCSLYTDLGLCFAYQGKGPVAINYLDTAIRLSKKYKYVYNQAYALIGLSTAYNLQKEYSKAYEHAMAGQALAIRLGNLSVRANASLQLSKTLAGLGRFNDAYTYLNQYMDMKTKLKDNESIQKLTSYNYDLDFATKERQLQEQQREQTLLYQQKIASQRSINIIFGIIILAMVIILVNYYMQRRRQQKINAKLEEKNYEVLQQKASLDEQTSELNDLNKLKDRLISILAHDLRAPLSTLRGMFDLLQDDTITHQEMLDMIPGVLKKLEYTSDFLDTLLFWINSQMESFVSSVTTFSVKDVVRYEVENYHDAAEQKGVKLIDHVAKGLSASADPNSIRIVIRNLITNAIKFTGKGDTIEVISEEQNENTIVIRVKDSGVGMPAEQAGKLFKSKVDSKTGTNNELGTGMGLLFCKDLVEKCNGKIWVTSEPGVGTEFSFTIPVYSLPVEGKMLAQA
ncbi:tetratricopeptide repeat-containing sensor histidine kinase [Mucilaginibacter sp. ZT4R22]|uniref:histidine kinase n=1 Tax=Mucilaginibacter pankratovii TaxID=2772110 RepID=A0ABR7WM72_9SPHI|nr:tetratricopeptide repeat-containing sensor histidine kinase [Mucilaginibacter pankratovii]MBD1363418.1 tetratricopeptide repeat-containing sensor histidine kinase [Mucilaginibacter pankratovii]